jgi:hypothetical protein
MIRQSTYESISETFGTSIGVANILGYKSRSEGKEEYTTTTSFRKFNDDLDINEIICESIDEGKYQQLQRELYRLKGKVRSKIKEVTIYKKAWKETYGVSNKSK